MKPIAAIIEASVDLNKIAREILKSVVASQDIEKRISAAKLHIETAQRKIDDLYAEQRELNAETGRKLICAKAAAGHGGWLPYLAKLGIPDRTARDWMDLARIADGPKTAPGSGGADLKSRRKRKASSDKSTHAAETGADSDSDDADGDGDDAPQSSIDVDRELSKLQNKICAFAESVTADARRTIAHELRETARLIEEMQ